MNLSHCRGNPKMCAQVGYCLHAKVHRLEKPCGAK